MKIHCQENRLNIVPAGLTCIDLAKRMRLIAMGCENGRVLLADSLGDTKFDIKLKASIRKVQFLDKNERLAALDEHNRLTIIDFSGNILSETNFKEYWSSIEATKKGWVLWGWKASPLIVNKNGKPIKEIKLPSSIRRLIAIQKNDRYFVVHNQLNVAWYNSDGIPLGNARNPSPIDLSRERPSILTTDANGRKLAISCFHEGVFIYDLNTVSMQQLDLDRSIDYVSVSQDGKKLCLADATGNLYITNDDCKVIWEKEGHAPMIWCALSQKGKCLYTLDSERNFVIYDFTLNEKKRSQFLEIETSKNNCVIRKSWHDRAKLKEGNFWLESSQCGNLILWGVDRDFLGTNRQGQRIFRKKFLSSISNIYFVNEGKCILFQARDEVTLLNHPYKDEISLSLNNQKILEISTDESSDTFFILLNNDVILSLSDSCDIKWKRKLGKNLSLLCYLAKHQCLFFVSEEKTLFRLDISRSKISRRNLKDKITALHKGPDHLFVTTSKGSLICLNSSGKTIWSIQLENRIKEMIFIEKKVTAQLDNQTTITINPNGEIISKRSLKNPYSKPFIRNTEMIEIYSDNHSIYLHPENKDHSPSKIGSRSPIRLYLCHTKLQSILYTDKTGLHCWGFGGETNQEMNERMSFLEIET